MDTSSLFWTAVLVIVAVSLLSDVGVLLGKFVVEPLVHWFQRRVLGIDAVRAGPEMMIGAPAKVTRVAQQPTSSGYTGHVLVHGEEWAAVCQQPLSPGTMVTVIERVDLTVTVVLHGDDR